MTNSCIQHGFEVKSGIDPLIISALDIKMPKPPLKPAARRAAPAPASKAQPPGAPESGPVDSAARKGDLHLNAVQALRSMIVTGELAPGERLNERELCAKLSVSRTPVREAIKTLAQDGLLQVWPNRSPVVMPLDAAQTQALVEVVAAIEALAGELCATRITDAQVAELGILHYTMLRHHAEGDLRAYFGANKAFHRLIIECAGNPVLIWVWDLLALRVDRARYSSNLRAERWRQAIEEHGLVLERMKARDPQGAAQALRGHLHAGLSLVVQTLMDAEQSHLIGREDRGDPLG